jgi:hypothetical protein
MTTWADVVTTALLGTDRRPVPTEIPGWARVAGVTGLGAPHQVLLDLAAAHRIAAGAGQRPRSGRAGATAAPRQVLRFAPAAAERLLDDVLILPEPAAVNAWLQTCAGLQLGLRPGYWAALAALAARSSAYDRAALAAALGERGRWFTHQNPAWRRLALALDEAAAAGGQLDQAAAGSPSPSGEQIERSFRGVTEPVPDVTIPPV